MGQSLHGFVHSFIVLAAFPDHPTFVQYSDERAAVVGLPNLNPNMLTKQVSEVISRFWEGEAPAKPFITKGVVSYSLKMEYGEHYSGYVN